MAYDGRVKFDTALDTDGLKSGLKSAENTAKKAAVAIGAAIGTGTAAAVKIGSDFESAMSSVYAISLATEEEAEKLKNAAIEAGEATKFSAKESANALEYLSLAGYSAEESIKALPKVLNLAAAGGMDLAYASDLLTDSMAVMGLGIDDMDNFSDQLAMAASKSNTSVSQLGEAVLVAGGQAALCKMEVSEMNTALGILADNGIKGSEGGTALRNALKNLYTPTSAAEKEMKKLGLTTADADGNLRDAQSVLKDLDNALSGLSEEEKVRAMSEIFDTRTISAATALLNNCNERWDELEGYLKDCDGAASKMAETMQDNLAGKLELCKSAAESCGIAFYESISEPLKDAADEGASQLSQLAKEMKEGELKEGIEELGEGLEVLVVDTIGLVRDVLPTLLKFTGNLCENAGELVPLILGTVAAFKAYSIATTAANAITAIFNTTLKLNPIGLVIAAVVALIGWLVSLKNAYQNAKEEDEEYRKEHDEMVESLEESLKLTQNNADECRRYADKIKELAKEEEKSAYQKEKMQTYVEALNELMPDLNLKYDKEADALKDVNGELIDNIDLIYDSIEAMEQRAKADAYYEHYKEAVKGQVDAEKDLEEQLEKTEKAQQEVEKFRAYYDENKGYMSWYEKNSNKKYIKQLEEEAEAEKEKLEKSVELYEEYELEKDEWYEKYYAVGAAEAEGMAGGINDNAYLVEDATTNMTLSPYERSKKFLNINSPSKLFRDGIGKAIPEGVAVGIEKNTDSMTEAFEKMKDVIDRQLEAELISEEKYLEELEKLRDKYLKQGTEEWLDETQTLWEKTKKLEEESIDNEIEILEYRYKVGEISEREYYKELEKIRDEYFSDNEEEWRKYNLKIVSYEKKAAEDTADKIKEAYTNAFEETNDSIESLGDKLKTIGDFYVTGSVEINGKDVAYGSLSDMKKRNEWLKDYQDKLLKVRERVSMLNLSKEDEGEFYEYLNSLSPEEGKNFAQLLLGSSDFDFSEYVRGFVENMKLSEEIAEGIFAEDKKDDAVSFYNELEEILKDAGKELPEDFFDWGVSAGELFSESFLEGVRSAIEEAKRELSDFGITTSEGSGSPTFSAVYNFYSSNQTVSEQLSDAARSEQVSRARYAM